MISSFQKIQNYENRVKNEKVRANLRFFFFGADMLKFDQKNVAKISNQHFSVRVSKNRENLIFELVVVLGTKFSGEYDRIIRIIFWDR